MDNGMLPVWIALGAAFMGVMTIFIALMAANKKKRDKGQG